MWQFFSAGGEGWEGTVLKKLLILKNFSRDGKSDMFHFILPHQKRHSWGNAHPALASPATKYNSYKTRTMSEGL